MTSPRIVFCDIDGTLVDHTQRLPASAARAVQQARADGVLVYVCTGRARASIPTHVSAIGFDGVISAGGGFTEADGVLVAERVMDAADLCELVDFFLAHDISYNLQGYDDAYPSSGMLAQMAPLLRGLRDTARDIEASGDVTSAAALRERAERLEAGFAYRGPAPREGIAKVTFLGPTRDCYRIVRDGVGGPEGRFHVITGSIPHFDESSGEVSLRGMHKGAALVAECQRLGIPLSSAMAVGDSTNDIEMLHAAGIGVAMGGSSDAVLAAADEVTDAVADGGLWNAFARHGIVR